ncbi:putative membrane protein [Helianthus anomalus]
MGVVRRHDNVLMIVPPGEPMSTDCRWSYGPLPTYVEGLVLTCDESQNVDALPV